jgi:hypothetical protein
MTDHHRSVIGMAITNAEKQASWRERHLKNENGTKLRARFIFDASTRAQLQADCLSQGLPCDVSHQVAASAERRITHSSRARR